MTDRPDALRRLELQFKIVMLVHERVAHLHRELGVLGGHTAEALQLLHKSAQIALTETPALLREVGEMAMRWEEQELLDPPAAIETLIALEAGLDEVDAELQALHRRHAQIAGQMQILLEQAGGEMR